MPAEEEVARAAMEEAAEEVERKPPRRARRSQPRHEPVAMGPSADEIEASLAAETEEEQAIEAE